MRIGIDYTAAINQTSEETLRASGVGSIVNITSLAALPTARDTPAHTDLMLYGVTKAALDRLTTYFAAELKPYGIAVNGLSPGGVLTETWKRVAPEDYAEAERTGKARRPVPEDMGPALICLAGQTADTITGRILHTNDFGTAWP